MTVLKWVGGFLAATAFTGLSVIALHQFDKRVIKIPGFPHVS